MVRPIAALLLAGLLAGCAGTGTGSRGWPDGSAGDVRWGGPYGPPGGYWRGRDYGYRDDYGDRRPAYRRDHGGRTFRPDGNVVCDRATRTCYRGREIDASETRDYFGNRAARRVDRLRDAAGTNRIFRPEDDLVCNRRERVCERDGRPDRRGTREFFGRRAARSLRRPNADPG